MNPQIQVLILIVVDNGLVRSLMISTSMGLNVLILIVVDNGLVPVRISGDNIRNCQS